MSLIDLPPTLLDLAGIPVPGHMQGRSIKPLIEDNNAPWEDEIYVQTSEAGIGRTLRTRRWKYIVNSDEDVGKEDNGCRSRYHEVEFYDLEADPYELTNLVHMDAFAEVIAYMRGRLIARAAEAGEPPILEIVEAERGKSGQRKANVVEW